MSASRPCPACLSTDARVAGPKNGYDILVCRSCGTIYTSRLPEASETEDYDAYYTDANLTTPEFIRDRVREIVEEFATYRVTNRFLEIGFGAGTILSEAQRQGWDAYGTEVSATACEHAREAGRQVFHGELREAKFESDHFDIVAASEILEHLPDPAAELAEIVRILRPGGLFWATTPSARSLSFRVMGPEWTTISPPEHTQLYSIAGARLMLLKAGFEEIRLVTSGLNPSEIVNHFRGGPAHGERFDRVGTAYELNEKLTRSPLRRGIKDGLNSMINLLGVGDSIKIFAVKPQ
jgi:SAM-dependent methyltransferase